MNLALLLWLGLAASVAGLRHKYCIVGAGPGGLQVALALQERGRDYVLFERGPSSGAFFDEYPRHRILNTHLNPVDSPRTDSLSLLGGPASELQATSDGRVAASDYAAYLRRASEGLNIQYNTEVNVQPSGDQTQQAGPRRFILRERTTGQPHDCNVVVLAFGLSTPLRDSVVAYGGEFLEDYGSMPIDATAYTNQTVCLLGNGQSAVETAVHLVGTAAAVRLIGRRPVRWASETNSPEDVSNLGDRGRSLASGRVSFEHSSEPQAVIKTGNGQFAVLPHAELSGLGDLLAAPNKCAEDSTSGKCAEGSAPGGKFIQENPYIGERFMQMRQTVGEVQRALIEKRDFYTASACDRVISCAGFSADSSVFDDSTPLLWHPTSPQHGDQDPVKYPVLDPVYQAVGQPHLYFSGSLTRGPGAGAGHVASFRWHSRALVRHLEMAYEREPWPSTTLPRLTPLMLADVIIGRLQESVLRDTGRCSPEGLAPGNDHQGARALVDVIVLSADSTAAVHYPEVPESYAFAVTAGRPFVAVGFTHEVTTDQVSGRGRRVDASGPHPILYQYRNGSLVSTHQFASDEAGLFKSGSRHIAPLVDWVRGVLKPRPS